MTEAKRTRLIRHHVRPLGRLGITVHGCHDRSIYKIEPAKKHESTASEPVPHSITNAEPA